jgi:hypothetical protein
VDVGHAGRACATRCESNVAGLSGRCLCPGGVEPGSVGTIPNLLVLVWVSVVREINLPPTRVPIEIAEAAAGIATAGHACSPPSGSVV